MSSLGRESILPNLTQRLSLTRRAKSMSPPNLTQRLSLTRRAKSMSPLGLTRRAKSSSLTSSPLTPRRKVKRTLAKIRIAQTIKNSVLRNRGLQRIKLRNVMAKDKMCSICLLDFDDINEATLTSCNHIFHGSCLEDWLAQPISRNKCPICKQDMKTFITIAESGLALSQIEKLRLATQNITDKTHDTLISKLNNFENGLVTLEQQFNELYRTNPNIDINYQYIQLLTDYYFLLIKKIINIYSDVYPDNGTRFKHINAESVQLRAIVKRMIPRQLAKMSDEEKVTHIENETSDVLHNFEELKQIVPFSPIMSIAYLYIKNPFSSLN
jgi:hypothetical protein